VADFQHHDFQCDFRPFLKLTRFRRKSGAKVLLFYELTKFLGQKIAKKHHFSHKFLIINSTLLALLFEEMALRSLLYRGSAKSATI
jgi:hypothetical protein